MSHISNARLRDRRSQPHTQGTAIAAAGADELSPRIESMAAPIALAIVVGSTPVLAAAVALITALGA